VETLEGNKGWEGSQTRVDSMVGRFGRSGKRRASDGDWFWGMAIFHRVRVAQVKAAAMPQTALQEPTTAVCFLGPCGIQNRMTSLVNFGESGKNFIEIGKRPRVQETMLGLAMPLRQTEFRKRRSKQCRSANSERATWKFRPSA
jgi:hypothetical protein